MQEFSTHGPGATSSPINDGHLPEAGAAARACEREQGRWGEDSEPSRRRPTLSLVVGGSVIVTVLIDAGTDGVWAEAVIDD